MNKKGMVGIRLNSNHPFLGTLFFKPVCDINKKYWKSRQDLHDTPKEIKEIADIVRSVCKDERSCSYINRQKNGGIKMHGKKAISFVASLLLSSMILAPTAMAASKSTAAIGTSAADIGVEYKTHIQDYGWETQWISDGDLSGTVGESKRLEALRVELTGDAPLGAKIETWVHVQNYGDLGPFTMGTAAGTSSQGLRLERIRLVLSGLSGYELRYNVQVQNKGWLRDETDSSTWFVSGETAGTEGEGLRLEGIRIKLVHTNPYLALYYNTLAAVDESKYTEESWAEYQDVVDDHKVTTSNTDTEILQAITAVLMARDLLVKEIDLSAYEAALEAVKEAEYTPESWATYQDIVDANVVTLSNTQAQIDNATSNILEAQKQLQPKVNLTEYLELVASLREDDYTSDSWAVYQQVLAANVVDENNTQTEVDYAVGKILAAQKELVLKFDFSTYNSILNAVEEEDYTDVSWTIYQRVVDKNVVTENDTQTDVEEAIKNIMAAQEKLVRISDLTAYEAALEMVSEDDYSADSWSAYQKVVVKNQVTQNNTQAEIDKATENILEAQKELEALGNLQTYRLLLARVDESNYTTDSWRTYQKVVVANEVTAKDGQDAIDKAVDKIRAAQAKLEPIGSMAAYLAVLNAVDQDDYTSESWAKYQKVVYANEVTAKDGQDDIDKATDKIKAAQMKLEVRLSDADWEDFLEDIEATYNGNKWLYTTDSWADFQEVLDQYGDNKYINEDDADAALKKIKSAAKKLVLRITELDYADYLQKIDEYIYSQAQDYLYTPASWADFQDVLDEYTLTDDNSKKDVDASLKKIKAAAKKLVLRVTDATWAMYYGVISSVGDKATYTSDSWADYMKVAEKYGNLTQDDSEKNVLAAYYKMDDAVSDLVVAAGDALFVQYDTLYHALDGKESNYTSKTWAAYQKVLNDKKNILTRDSSETEIKDAIRAIEQAVAALDEGPVTLLADYQAVLDKVPATDSDKYTDESWTAYMAIVQANYVDRDSTEKEINKAKAAISAAQTGVLVFNADTQAFEDAIALFIENLDTISGTIEYKIDNSLTGTYAKHLACEPNGTSYEDGKTSWLKYANLVRKYASFNDDGSWNSYGNKDIDIVKEDGQEAIDQATQELLNAKAAFKRPDAYQDAWDEYLDLLIDDADELDYTTGTWAMYKKIVNDESVDTEPESKFNMLKDGDYIKTDYSEILAVTTELKKQLLIDPTGSKTDPANRKYPVEHVSDATYTLLENEWTIYNTTVSNVNYGIADYGTLWTPYLTTCARYINDSAGTWDQQEKSEAECQEAITALQTAYTTLTNGGATASVAPVITNDLVSTSYSTDAVATALDATATVTDGGTITYQWYENTSASNTDGTAITGQISATYTPPTATAETYYYYCVVTNTAGTRTPSTITSNVATITVS
jgi:hypothetical protein